MPVLFTDILHIRVYERTEKIPAEVITGIVMSFVRPSVCNAVHCGFQGRRRGLKVVPACSWQASSYLSLQPLLP